ncbi:hypothetical protein [Sphingobium sp. LSP13-1-1.1]|uniref:hypothetical protein n=1 Tax=Sphingobium sp. LSP13-1-1.1 TaxID=3135234 RepID=UPI003422290F
MKRNFDPITNEASTLRRKARHTRIKNGKRSKVVSDSREGIQKDGSVIVLHPTKGFRRISAKRIKLYSTNN